MEPIKVTGLAELTRALKKVDSDLPKAMRLANNEAANVVVRGALALNVPSRSGKAAKSIKAKSTRTEGRVQGGGNQAPYYPWLDFGGRVGRRHSVVREFIKEGRFIYPAYKQNKEQVRDAYEMALRNLCISAGLGVSGG